MHIITCGIIYHQNWRIGPITRGRQRVTVMV